jgi:hypothetical protein
MNGEVSAASLHTTAGTGVPPQHPSGPQQGQMVGRAIAGAALSTSIAVMSSTTVTNSIKRLMRYPFSLDASHRSCSSARGSESCEEGATSENSVQEKFREFIF